MDLFEHILSLLKDHEQRISGRLLSGAASDYATYKNMTGVLTGLTLASNEIKEVRKSYMENDSDN